MRRTLAIVVVVLASVVAVRAQLPPWRVVWTQLNASPADALAFEYAVLIDATTRVPLAGVSCATVNNATECQAPAPDVTSCKTSVVLQARNPFGTSSSAPLTCLAPGPPTTYRFTLTVIVGD